MFIYVSVAILREENMMVYIRSYCGPQKIHLGECPNRVRLALNTALPQLQNR